MSESQLILKRWADVWSAHFFSSLADGLLGISDFVEKLLGLFAGDLLKGGGKVFGVAETYAIGNVADAEVGIVLGKLDGGLDADVANEDRHILAGQCTQLVVERTGTGSHIGSKGVTVVVAVVYVVVNTLGSLLQELVVGRVVGLLYKTAKRLIALGNPLRQFDGRNIQLDVAGNMERRGLIFGRWLIRNRLSVLLHQQHVFLNGQFDNNHITVAFEKFTTDSAMMQHGQLAGNDKTHP